MNATKQQIDAIFSTALNLPDDAQRQTFLERACAGDGPQYIDFQNAVEAGLAKITAAYPGATIELDGMIWTQGETDITADSAMAAAYGANLVNFINNVRLVYATNVPYGTNLPFILSRISANQTIYSLPSDAQYTNYLLVLAGQAYAAAALPDTFMMDTDGAQYKVNSDDLHFNTGGQQALGTAFAQSLIGALPQPEMQSVDKLSNAWRITFEGASGLNYSLERATSLAGPWSTLTNIIMGPSGNAYFDDANLLPMTAFYRVSYP